MNIYDIAREAGVSISTVSKYLNNKNIRPELKEKIEYVIKKYNYVPSAVAQGLVSKSLKLIAVMVVDLQVSYYAAAAYTIDKILSKLGYRVIICNTLGDEENSIRYLDSLMKLSVDGIIFIGSIFEFLNKYPKVLNKIDNVPIICNNGHINTKNSHSVYADDRVGVYQATEYLIKKGRKNIVYLKYLTTASSNLKCQGYKDAIDKYGLKQTIYYTNDLMTAGYEDIKKMLEDDVAKDAIVCGEDLLALSCISQLSALNYKIGVDIDVIGFNASIFTDVSNPKMTSIDNKVEETSVKCADMLLDVLQGKEVKDITIPCSLVIKDSA